MKPTSALITCLWILATSQAAGPGPNPEFTLPLHIAGSSYLPCNGYLPVDCVNHRPTVNLTDGGPVAVFFFFANHQQVSTVQGGLEWDPSWSYGFSLFDCLPGQLEGFFRDGPNTASGVTTFNCVEGPALAAFGRMFFVAGDKGCLRYIQPKWPFGIHVVDCALQIDQIMDPGSPRLGRVCVGSGGIDACERVVPVAATTWGAIKDSYR